MIIRPEIQTLDSVKLILPILFTALVFIIPITWQKWLARFEKFFAHCARYPATWLLLIGSFVFIGNLSIHYFIEKPVPSVQDEFSYLLAADTYASGRLTNPTHKFWIFFETFYVLQQPSYTSKYPPAQGIMLALGKVIANQPMVGIWLSTALMIIAIGWLLLGWLPPRWALLGTILAALHFGLFTYWSQSYWGGAITATGGALLFGSLRRLIRQPKIQHSLIMGLGLILLANSRPFEGLVASIPVVLVLAGWLTSKHRPAFPKLLQTVVLPLLVMIGINAILIGYYNYRVSGNALTIPYLIYERNYTPVPNFIWQPPHFDITYHHQVMRDFYLDSLNWYQFYRSSWQAILIGATIKFRVFWLFYLGIIFTIPLVAIRAILHNRWQRIALITILLLLTAFCLETYTQTHYLAPITGLTMIIVTQGLRHLDKWKLRERRVGSWLVWSSLFCYIVIILVHWQLHFVATEPQDWSIYRANLEQKLEEDSYQHLIFVHYGKNHIPGYEWVYNRADIDNAKVVWARYIDPETNCQLINYFPNRKVWWIDIDNDELLPQFGNYQNSNCSTVKPKENLE